MTEVSRFFFLEPLFKKLIDEGGDSDVSEFGASNLILNLILELGQKIMAYSPGFSYLVVDVHRNAGTQHRLD